MDILSLHAHLLFTFAFISTSALLNQPRNILTFSLPKTNY